MRNNDKPRILVFSMAFNGYQYLFRRSIETHRAYARTHGFDYAFIRKPYFTRLMLECTWLKIPLISSALANDYDWVCFVDADTEIRPDCPSLVSVMQPGKSVYMVNGCSGRVNAGVILVKKTREAIDMFARILKSFDKPLPPEDMVGWGDNGHVIHYTKHFEGLCILPSEWNNNRDPKMRDYIRHYSDGIMRKMYPWHPVTRIVAESTRLAQRVVQRCCERFDYPAGFPGRLYRLYTTCLSGQEHFAVLSKERMFESTMGTGMGA
jgi:hypothetical protein